MSKNCIDLHTPHLKSKFNKLIKSGVKEKDAELEIAIEEAKRIFNSLNNLKTKLGIKLSEEDEITNAIVTTKAEDFQDLSETFDLEGELKTNIAALEKIIKDAESEDAPATVKQELIEKGNAKLAEMKAELVTMQQSKNETSSIDDKKADIERRRQEEIDSLFSKTQASTDKQLNTPVQKLSKEEVNKNIETAKLQNKDLIEELENPKFLNDEKRNDEWDKKADELSDKLPQGVSFRITDGKVDFFDDQSYREKGFGKNIVQVSAGNLHNKTEKFEIGDNIQVQDGSRAMPAIVTKVNENGKILEAKQEDGRIIISRGNIVTLAPINDRLKINAKYDAELAALKTPKEKLQENINDLNIVQDISFKAQEIKNKAQSKLDELNKTEENKQETPIEKLRRLAKEKIEESKLQFTSEFNYRGGTYTIDYKRNLLSPIPKTATAQKNLIDFMDKQKIEDKKVYDISIKKINDKDVYLVYHNFLDKFVFLDKNLNSIPLDESVVTSKAYQDAQNRCK